MVTEPSSSIVSRVPKGQDVSSEVGADGAVGQGSTNRGLERTSEQME